MDILSSLRVDSAQASTTVAATPAHFHTPQSFAGTLTPNNSYPTTPQPPTPAQLAPAPAPDQPASGALGSLDLSGTSWAASTSADAGGAAGAAAIAIPLPSPSLLNGPPPPPWAESVSPETPGGWLSMPPSYFASDLVRVEEEVGSPGEAGTWAGEREREGARRPSLVGAVRSFRESG